MPSIKKNSNKTPIKIKISEIDKIQNNFEKFQRKKKFKNLTVTGKNINNSFDMKKSVNSNLKIRNFTHFKNNIMNKTQIIARNKTLDEKEFKLIKDNFDNQKDKMGVLYEFEKKSLIIQKMLRGCLIRKKYEKKLTNLKQNNINKDNNNINNKTKNNENNEKNKKIKNLDESSSLRSELSNISLNSKDLNFSEEESEDIKESDLPSDID